MPLHFASLRQSAPTIERVEAVLGAINKGIAVTYSSGLSAAYAALLHLAPKRIAIRGGYQGTHGVVKLYRRQSPIPVIDLDDSFAEGDVVWLETPLNPTGEIADVSAYADRAHAVGAKLVVDSTFAPPPLSWPIELGADIVMHSATKYFAGHSDALGGVLIVKSQEEAAQLLEDRTCLGSVLGSLEAWLILRSIRTLKLRVLQQSQTAAQLVAWLNLASGGKAHDGIPANAVHSVTHSTLQELGWDVERQLPGGHGSVFSVLLSTHEAAERLAHRLQLFHAATSLGGVESLAEWRHFWDKGVDERLVRISVGLEDVEDLKEDLRRALQDLALP
ncbi:hypothetical protein HDU84_001127 [Entophlyctis sp. JEL0112]|nr:hypothetical protein HDU84_001127 [Entophlyctis sp. JEL0112]